MKGIKKLAAIDKRFKRPDVKKAIERMSSLYDDPEEYVDSLIYYGSVLRSGRFRIKNYLNAVRFVSLKAQGLTSTEAYKLTFPERLEGRGERSINGFASEYASNALVRELLVQVQIPLNILMIGERIKMANKLAWLAMNAESERVQMESADKLLNHIKVPESVKMELDVGYKADDTIKSIDEKLTAFAKLAQERIKQQRMTPVEVIES